ncbi:LysR family transcriptional regulator [Thalassotalea profundi]|uniref:LysR family transcriptional regulator n=1 Tax=Thalassotalea profundi TaxID=2036687 RepID=A0ABQ3IHB0_9GAMM|nr:LysR family transcriptional regulator [Thalassotalea profundi]GHE83389.1 LysR family transcriptional regulator [Thalassotalea profundi]
MDIRLFKTFIQVAETKHFGRASENLFITQAAVSARIKQLEEYYATALFIRNKNNLKLTASGDALLTHAYLLVEQLEQSKQTLALTQQQKINFNIAATPNIWDAFLSKRIHESIVFFDNVTLGTEISVREAIQRKLSDKTLDLGLLTDPIKDEDYNNQLIAHFELALVGSSSDQNNILHQYIFVDWGLTFSKEHNHYHKFQPLLKTSTAMIALEVILSKGGFAYLPLELVMPYIKEKKLFIIDSPLMIKRPIYMVSKNSSFSKELIKQYGEFIESTNY